jgi:hypothetical protein
VKIHCVSRENRDVLVRIHSNYGWVADGSVELYLHGSVEARSDSSVTVRASDGHTVTCSVPAGTNLSAFEVGTSVKMHCHKRDGEFRLAYLKSEHAVIELER